MAMFEKIKETEDRYHELETLLGQPKILQDQKRYRKYAKEHSVLTPIITILHNIRPFRMKFPKTDPFWKTRTLR